MKDWRAQLQELGSKNPAQRAESILSYLYGKAKNRTCSIEDLADDISELYTREELSKAIVVIAVGFNWKRLM